MDEITVETFRCFRHRQTARLAPLTLLVGDNSTGKTSFMALIRAIWDAAYVDAAMPDFKEEPFDLGSFDEIVHHRGARGSKATQFFAGFRSRVGARTGNPTKRLARQALRFQATFDKHETAPIVSSRHIARGKIAIEERRQADGAQELELRTGRGSWSYPSPTGFGEIPLAFRIRLAMDLTDEEELALKASGTAGGEPSEKDLEELHRLAQVLMSWRVGPNIRPFATAPVRSRPRRTYDPTRPVRDPEGEGIPMYLARMFFHDPQRWESMRDLLESYGRSLGIFNELRVRPLGKKDAQPFQVEVRKFDGRFRGPWRNLIDVGYGVSQVLPILIELVRENASSILLLQQPEVHLHPSAQAALGTAFCQTAQPRRQIVLETHSDHLIDRVRMDVRDGTTPLQPDDVSILFFERSGLDVRIHSIRMDGDGNILDAPNCYRQFFMEETNRSLAIY